MSILRRLSETLRHLFALGEGKLQFGRGVRTAFALIVPVLLGGILAQPLLSWAALGGWLGSLADKGGSYRTRAMTMSALGILGALCALSGTSAAHSVPIAVVSMLTVGIIGGLGRVYGDEGSTVGLFVAVIYAVAVGSRSAVPHAATLRAEMFLGGVAWAMLLSLLLWPLHPFRPARRAVADSYRALVEFAVALRDVSMALGDERASAARERARALHATVRSALEHARLVLGALRRSRQGRSPRGEQLVVLNEGAEQLFGTLVAIDAELEAAHESGTAAGDEAFVTLFASLAETLDALTTAIDDSLDARSARTPEQGLAELTVRSEWTNVHLRAAAQLLSRLAGDVRVLVETASQLDLRAATVVPATAEHPVTQPITRDPFAWLRPLHDALTPSSLPLRHGLRMGVAAGAAVWLSFALDISRGYWATITTLIVLQPYAGATMRKTLQRVGGSILGGIIAAALAVIARTKLAIAGVMVPFTIGAVAVLPLNYGIFVVLLTPVFVLLAEPHPGDWGVAGLRVANTLMGGVIALAASQLLWPVHEMTTYVGRLAGLVRELRALADVVTGPGDATASGWKHNVAEARRRFGVAVTNAEATMQRLITEEAPSPHRVEAAVTVLTYGRRMASTLSAITESRAADGRPIDDLRRRAILAELDALIESLATRSIVSPGPPFDSVATALASTGAGVPAAIVAQTLQRAQLERLEAQLAVLRRAVQRYLAA